MIRDTLHADVVHLGTDSVNRRAIGAHDAEHGNRHPALSRANPRTHDQRATEVDHHGLIAGAVVDHQVGDLEFDSGSIGRALLERGLLALMPGQVRLAHLEDIAKLHQRTMIEPQGMAAQFLRVIHAVGDQQQGAALLEVFLHPADALLLERLVTDGEDLVGDQQIRFQRGNDGEAQAHDHARGIVLDRLIDVSADIGELDDLLHARRELFVTQAVQGRGHFDIVAAAVFGMKPGTKLKQGADAAGHLDLAAAWRQHAGDQLEQGRLARSVLPDDRDRLAPADAKVDVLDHVLRIGVAASDQQARQGAQAVTGQVSLRIGLADTACLDQDRVHRKSSKCGSRRRNNQKPKARVRPATRMAISKPCQGNSP